MMSSDTRFEAVLPREIPQILYHYTNLASALNIIHGGDNDEQAICFLLKNAASKNDEFELKLGEIVVNKVRDVIKSSGFNSLLNNVKYEPSKIYLNSFTENGEVNEYMLKEYGNVRLEFAFPHLTDRRYFNECDYLCGEDADDIANAYLSNFELFKKAPSLSSYCQYIPNILSLVYHVPFIKYRGKWEKETEWRHVFYEQRNDPRRYQHNGFEKLKVYYAKQCLIGVTLFSPNLNNNDDRKEYDVLRQHIKNKGWGDICKFSIFK